MNSKRYKQKNTKLKLEKKTKTKQNQLQTYVKPKKTLLIPKKLNETLRKNKTNWVSERRDKKG